MRDSSIFSVALAAMAVCAQSYAQVGMSTRDLELKVDAYCSRWAEVVRVPDSKLGEFLNDCKRKVTNRNACVKAAYSKLIVFSENRPSLDERNATYEKELNQCNLMLQ